jgi:DNA-binding HxlR family transcriptional regulator
MARYLGSRATCRLGGVKIDIEQLIRISDLFRFRWDPPILAVLAEAPFRFRALHGRLEAHVGEHVDDNALTRSLYRLTRAGLVRIDTIRSGRRPIKTYSLSDKGREHLATYEALVAVYTHLRLPSAKCGGLCPVHERRPMERTEATDSMYVPNCQ